MFVKTLWMWASFYYVEEVVVYRVKEEEEFVFLCVVEQTAKFNVNISSQELLKQQSFLLSHMWMQTFRESLPLQHS